MNGLLTFTKYDYDGTNQLDLAEFVAMMADLRRTMPAAFRSFKFTDIPQIFDELDKGADGTISRAEFLHWWNRVATKGHDALGDEEFKNPEHSSRAGPPSKSRDLPTRVQRESFSAGGKQPREELV